MASHPKQKNLDSDERQMEVGRRESTDSEETTPFDYDLLVFDVYPRSLVFRWFRHSGEPEIQRLPDWRDIIDNSVQFLSEVKDVVGDNSITHAFIYLPDGLDSSMIQILSKITHLGLLGVVSSPPLHSLSQLTQLKVLDLSGNYFTDGVPGVVGEIKGLCELNLKGCKITDLPESLENLKNLTTLDLSENYLTRLPSVVYKLTSLNKLNLFHNNHLTTIDEEIVELTALRELNCGWCNSLTRPPSAVCIEGVEAVKRYFKDLKAARGVKFTPVPVAFIGKTNAGKTSLGRSLQQDKRVLTVRIERSLVDDATKAFDLNDLSLADSQAKLIDYGGHEIYHLTYCVINKERYVPLIVVNMEEFSSLVKCEGAKEATRKVCFNWLSHLFLACPELGPPLLVLTHIDMLDGSALRERRQDLLSMTEEIREELLEEEKLTSNFWEGKFSRIKHLSNRSTPVFSEDDVFEFGKDESVTSNIADLKDKLNIRCKELSVEIPRLWEDVDTFIQQQTDAPYVSLADIESHFPSGDCQTILKYMHNTGSVLWFQQFPAFRDYVFHRIPAIRDMINVLFHHCAEEQWTQRLDKFKGFSYGNRILNRTGYKQLMERFKETGELDEAVLHHLLQTESIFSSDMAVDLLRHFHILHGPIIRGSLKFYIIPYFSTCPMGDAWKTDGRVQQRLEMHLGSFAFPKYAHYLITGLFLNHTVKDDFSEPSIRSDGATVEHSGNAIHLVHDVDGRKITLQTSTDVHSLGDSWKLLLETTNHILEHISSTWKACLVSIHTFCSHCLFLRDPKPDHKVNPGWLYPRYAPGGKISAEVKVCSGRVYMVKCRRHVDMSKDSKPTVPSPLVLPYYELTEKEMCEVDSYLSLIEPQRVHQPQAVNTDVQISTLPVEEHGETGEEMKLPDAEEIIPKKLELSAHVNTELHGCLRGNGVLHYQLLQNPREDKKVKVVGEKVEMFHEELSRVASKHGFELSSQNIAIHLGPKGLPLLSNWIDCCVGVIRDPQYTINLSHRPIVTVNAIMQGRLAGRQRNTEELFALTTAHAVLNEERRQLLDGCTAYFEGISDQVALEWLKKDYYMAVKEGDNVDIRPPPRWLYKYWVREGDDSEWCAYQDIAFLHLDESQVAAGGLIDSGNKSVHSLERQLSMFEDAYIEDISTETEAKHLIGERIVCRGLGGKIIKGSDTVGEDEKKDGHTIGMHLEFVFDDPTQRLEPGDCGSLLFLADKRNGKLPIVGMFFGQLVHDKQVHCALILSWNIKLAMQVEALNLYDIKLAGCYSHGDYQPSQMTYDQSDSLPLPTQASGDNEMDVAAANVASTSVGMVGMATGYRQRASTVNVEGQEEEPRLSRAGRLEGPHSRTGNYEEQQSTRVNRSGRHRRRKAE